MELPPPCRGNNRISILLSCRVHSELSMGALATEFCHTPVQVCVKAANPLSPVLFVIADGCPEPPHLAGLPGTSSWKLD